MASRRLTLPIERVKTLHRQACKHPHNMNMYRVLWSKVAKCKNVAKQAYITKDGRHIVYMIDKDMSIPSDTVKGFAYIISEGGDVTTRKFDVDNITQLRTHVRDLAQA